MAPKHTLLTIPTEMVERIAFFLPEPKDLINLRLSNYAIATRCWQAFVDTFAKEVELEYNDWPHSERNHARMQQLNGLPQLANHVNFLTLRTRVGHWLAMEGFRGYNGLLTNLRSLCLSYITIKDYLSLHTRCLNDLAWSHYPSWRNSDFRSVKTSRHAV